ncbi:DNA-binding TFAR19-related protein [Peniophora sp. CONT]|nr:DNA-binding TFAR19-related protein [Peniophora sp. CONT]
MADDELAAIRAARMQQLQQESSSRGGRGGGGDSDEAQKAQQQAQQIRELLATVLEPAARERLSRIALVAPDRSRQIEGILARMAQTGQLRGRVSEAQLIDLLQQAEDANSSAAKVGAIKFQRRVDDDDDWDI